MPKKRVAAPGGSRIAPRPIIDMFSPSNVTHSRDTGRYVLQVDATLSIPYLSPPTFYDGIAVGVAEITPDVARVLTSKERTDHNRRISAANVTKLGDTILAGQFKFNGDGISISKHGRNLNGNHRMAAIIRTNKSIVSAVSVGFEDDAFPSFDTNKARKGTDFIQIYERNDPDAKKLSTYTNTVVRTWRDFERTYYLRASGYKGTCGGDETVGFYIDIRDKAIYSAQFTVAYKSDLSKIGISPGEMSGFHHILTQVHGVNKADEFVRGFLTGQTGETDARSQMRDHLVARKASPKQGNYTADELRKIMVHTWNKYVQNDLIDRVDPRAWLKLVDADIKRS